MSQKLLPSDEDIIAVFEALPRNELLTYANQVQQRLLAGEHLDVMKDSGDPDSWVTVADTWIQERILHYFEHSALAGLYIVIAEETLATTTIPADVPYILVIDPLDGTSPFRKGSSEWGIMIALYSVQGSLQHYSWNLLSDGSLYASYLPPLTPLPAPTCDTFRIDHCAYGAEDLHLLVKALSQTLGIPESGMSIYTNPTAVLVGYKLLQGELDALLWVASDQGKRTIPVYDLSFLKALPSSQFVIKLATGEDEITLVVVARTEAVATALLRTAELLPWARLGKNQPSTLESVVLPLRTSRNLKQH